MFLLEDQPDSVIVASIFSLNLKFNYFPVLNYRCLLYRNAMARIYNLALIGWYFLLSAEPQINGNSSEMFK